MKNTIIFDVDGTLLNTEPLYINAWIEAGPRFGYEIGREVPLKTRGVSVQLCVREFQKAYGDDFPFHEIRAERIRIANELFYSMPKEELLMEGVQETLEALKEEGYSLAIASSTEINDTIEHLRHAGILEYFSSIVGGDMVEKGKPNPDPFLLAASMIGAKPSDCIVIGDSPNDILTAKAAGMEMILIPDVSPATDEQKAYCSAVLTSMKDALPVIHAITESSRGKETV